MPRKQQNRQQKSDEAAKTGGSNSLRSDERLFRVKRAPENPMAIASNRHTVKVSGLIDGTKIHTTRRDGGANCDSYERMNPTKEKRVGLAEGENVNCSSTAIDHSGPKANRAQNPALIQIFCPKGDSSSRGRSAIERKSHTIHRPNEEQN
jgi:hypothetical protein